jgi:hypothetical protein
MIDKFTREEVVKHWHACLPMDRQDLDAERKFAERETAAWTVWQLLDVPLADIFTIHGTPLDNDQFFRERIVAYEKLGTSLPAIVLKPFDREQVRHPWLRQQGVRKWEPADGVHRVVMAHRAGASRIRAFVPVEEGAS